MDEDILSINVEYEFASFLGSKEPSNYIKEFEATIYCGECADNSANELVGSVFFKLVCVGQALNDDIDLLEMFDTYEYTFRHGMNFYEVSKGTFHNALLKEFPDLEFSYDSICIIEAMGVFPKFRGRKLGEKIFKDLVWNFGDTCCLFVIQPFPLQFESPNSTSLLLPKLELEKFEKDEKKANKKLSQLYESWGFKKVKGIKDLLFYCPLYKNKAFDDIDMYGY